MEHTRNILVKLISSLVVTLMLSVGFLFAGTPEKRSPEKRSRHALSAPAAPNIVLYDQYDNPTGNAWLSDFIAGVQGADDFVVPAGETWTIDEVDVQGAYFGPGPAAFQVFIYSVASGLPGTAVSTRLMQGYTSGNGIDFVVILNPAVILPEGTYWVSVQSIQDFFTGNWSWNDRSLQSGSPAAWQDPFDFFGTGCTAWGVRTTCWGGGGSDNMFRLVGTIGVPCTYYNDFNDTSQEWIEEKPTVIQPGDGFLHLTPLKKKAIAVADSSFAGASTGTYTYVVQFTGGIDKNWLNITRNDKKDALEVLIKVEQDKVIVKDRLRKVLAKAKADFTFAPNTNYTIEIVYDGTNVDVNIDGTPVIVDFVPSRSLPTANIGAAAMNNSLLIDSVCVN